MKGGSFARASEQREHVHLVPVDLKKSEAKANF